jgi:colanic acid/amylovoran biosynthesis protein
MGVSALFASAITGISQHLDPVEFVVFDNGLGRRDTIIKTEVGKEVCVIRFGARGGHRYHRPENLANMLLASRLGQFGASINGAIRLIDSCDAVLDVSGGDSFSDIYGPSRFNNIYRPKVIAINRGKPLILLPQTYGPFKNAAVRAVAEVVTRGASMAWARDENSFSILKELLGENFSPEKHLCGVDMAFGLPAKPALELLDTRLQYWLSNKVPDAPLLGFNISGLIYNDSQAAIAMYGFKADYRAVVYGFLSKVLADTKAQVVLIPHVMDKPGHYESDLAACMDVANKIDSSFADRIALAPCISDPSQVKWLISQMDWFCGTRMHSTIAGLSSGVPTATISYSDKAKGVFETCGQSGQIIDPRLIAENEIVTALFRSFNERLEIGKSLTEYLPSVRQLAKQQIHAVCRQIQSSTIG